VRPAGDRPDGQITALEAAFSPTIRCRRSADPGPPPKTTKTFARQLVDRLHRRLADILCFLHDLEVPFTNNQAEQDIRMAKAPLKVSGGCRNFNDLSGHLDRKVRGSADYRTKIRRDFRWRLPLAKIPIEGLTGGGRWAMLRSDAARQPRTPRDASGVEQVERIQDARNVGDLRRAELEIG
jgi:transposase